MPCDLRRKGGPLARLSFCLALSSLCAPPAAAGDPFEEALGLDYARQVLPAPDAPRPAVGALPGFGDPFPFAGTAIPGAAREPSWTDVPAEGGSAPDARPTGAPPRLEATATAWQRDLIRRDAHFSFAHRRDDRSLAFAWAAAPGLELRFAADRDRRRYSIGDSATAVDADGTDRGWRAALSFPFTPFLIPSVVVGARSSDPDADALEALAFRGAWPAGLSWSFAFGRSRRAYPVGVKLPGYAPLSLPFLWRRDFAEAGLAYARGAWELSWSGRGTWARPPAVRPQGYSLDDSARVWRQEARAAYARGGYAAALDFDLGLGRHVFRGLDRKQGTLYPFSWQRGRQTDYALRGDVSAAMRRGWAGVWLAAGETEYDALRPDSAFNHWFWDRNGVIDSYQGSLLGLFSSETWLLNGSVYAGHAGAGAWWRSAWKGLAFRAAAGYQYLLLRADSHLTRRRSEFLIGYTEDNEDRVYPAVEADLLPASLELGRSWGNLSVTMGGQAALPLRVRIERAGGGGGGGGGRGGADYGGGTVAGVRLGYRLP